MKNSRSNNVLIIGVAVFAVGALLTFLGLSHSGKKNNAAATQQSSGIAAATPGTSVRSVQVGQNQVATYTIPKGKQAVQVELPSVPGLGGYAKPGDLVNIYATVRNQQPTSRLKTPFVKLVLQNVKVLDVHAAGVAGGGNATYLLALDTNEAETVIFYAKYESMWLTLAATDQKPLTSAGHSYQNIL
jgi:Flp pilus assembly protein CpaB